MLLGKRPRPPMKRTTSMTEITFDLNLNTNSDGAPAPPPPSDSIATTTAHHNRQRQPIINSCGAAPQRRGGGLDQQIIVPTTTLSSTVSPRNHRRNSADFLETPHFLRACSLCNRRLIPGRDIYMYRYKFFILFFSHQSLYLFFFVRLFSLMGLFQILRKV